MQSKICRQVQSSDKNTKIKYPEGDKLFVGYTDGCLLEISMIEEEHIHDHGKILDNAFSLMAKTNDNKSLFVFGFEGNFVQLDIPTRKKVNSFIIKNASYFVVTHDGKYLITGESKENCNFTKQSLRTNKRLHTWQSGVNQGLASQSCSYDNKYQLIGYYYGWLTVFDLKKHQKLKNIEVISYAIFSVAFSRDNQRVFISDQEGSIKMIKWQANANSEDDFDFSEEPKILSDGVIISMCLTKDEKYLLVGQSESLRVVETETRKVTKEFRMKDYVQNIQLIQDGKKAIIAEDNGNISILNVETLEISSATKNIKNGTTLNTILVI